MLNKKIVISTLSIFVALGMMASATFAVFTSQALSTNNTFSSGNANLQIAPDLSGSPGEFESSLAGFTFENLFPGQIKQYDFWLRNNSSSIISLDLTSDISAVSPTDDGSQDIDNTLLVSWVCDQNGNGSLGDETSTSELSPRAWLNGGNASLGTLTSGQERKCRMFGRLPSDANDTIADESVSFDVTYDATQVVAP